MKKAQAKKSGAAKSKPLVDRGPTSSISSWTLPSESRILFLIVAATLLVYANSLSGAFVFDDTMQIVGNPNLHNWDNIARAFTRDVWSFQRGTLSANVQLPYYRPLFTTFLTLNYKIFGLWEPGWHLVNLLVHVAATVAVYFLLKRLSDGVVAGLAAAIFGLHPAHVESVSWISGIPDPLAALFYVPSFLWYVRYREDGQRKWLAASVVAFGLAILCKETPLVLPVVLCVWELTRQTERPNLSSRVKDLVLQMVPFAAVGVAYLVLRFSVLGLISWKHPNVAQVPDAMIWMSIPYVVVRYFQHLLLPFYLSLIYSPPFISSLTDPRVLVPVGLLAGLGMILWFYRRKLAPQEWLAIAMTVAPLLPVLNLKVFHQEYIIQDRYLYLPSIGFCFLFALLILRLAGKRVAPVMAFVVVVLLAFGASTVLQNRIWHDSVALWTRAIDYSPGSWAAHYNLGLGYLDHKEFEPARTELLKAQRLDPQDADTYNNLALAQAGLGRKDEALLSLRAALAIDQRLVEAHNNLGTLLYDKRDYAAAKLEFSGVLERDPANSTAHFNLAQTLAAMGDHSGAIREYEALLAKEPDDVPAHYQLGLSYAAMGRKADAIAQLNHALQIERNADRIAEMRKKLEQIQAQ